MILVVLIIGVLLFAGVVAFLVIGGLFKVESDQNKAEKDAARILDETFDGRRDVTFTTTMRTLKHATVVLGAKERGYRLANQVTGQYGYGTLMFELVEA